MFDESVSDPLGCMAETKPLGLLVKTLDGVSLPFSKDAKAFEKALAGADVGVLG